MSRRGRSRARDSGAPAAEAATASRQPGASMSEEEFELIDRNVGRNSPLAPAPGATEAEKEAYERALDAAHKANLLGLDLPPVVPPGHVLQPVVEPPKITFWTLLFRRAENRTALYQLYVTTGLMVVIPLGLMALTYYTVFSSYSSDARLMWSGFAGVLGVNVVSIGFGLFAYFEPASPEDEEEEASDAARARAEEQKRAKWEAWEAAQEEQESLENKERLRVLREKHEQKRKEESGDTAASSSSSSSSEFTRVTRSRSRARSSAARDSALADDDSAGAQPSEEQPSAQLTSRATRTRSRKM